MSNVGFRIFTKIHRPDPQLVESFRGLPVANIADEMNRFFCVDARIKPLNRSPLLGTAFTVRTRTADNLLMHKAIAMAQPGDVIVVDAGGDLTNALMGEMMLAYAIKRGVAGFVLNGALRDVDAFVATNLPTYAAGVTHRGPYKDGPGEINVPIAIDGMVIAPGDLILGDSDGVLAVPYDEAEAIYLRATAKLEAETKQMSAIAAGTNDRSWVDATLRKLGCALPEDA